MSFLVFVFVFVWHLDIIEVLVRMGRRYRMSGGGAVVEI